MNNSILYVILCAGIFGFYVAAQSLDELKNKFTELVAECLKEHPVTAEDLSKLQNKQAPENESTKCLFACAFKKAGMMDEKGFLSIEGVNQISHKYLANEPDKIKKSEELAEACRSVNDIPVADGDRGCDRAALIFKCSVEKTSQFNFL